MTLETQTLSRIMLLQNMLSHLGDQDSIVSFVCRGLEEMPGVTTATFLPEKPSHSSDLKTVYFPLQLNKNHYGEICLSLSNTDEFKPYKAYINNLCFMVAVILEERRQGQLNRQHQQHLEILVNERTKALQEEVQERRIAEERALKEKQRAELYLDISEAMIVELDKQGKICAINKRGCEILGYKQSVLLGQSWVKLCIPSHVQPITQNTFDQLMAGQERCNEYIENEIIRSDGETHNIAWHNMLQFDDEGEIASVLSSGIDITARKRVEAELVKHQEQLELLVEDRTRKLKETQSELLQSERLATLGRLTATVSHELRNPLGTIQTAIFSIGGFIEHNKPYLVERALELAERNILRCVNIVDDLTSYTRIKKLVLTKTFIDDWLRMYLEEQTIPKEIRCELDLQSGACASIDQEKLWQVMNNLINNAVHALLDENSNGDLLHISTHLLDGEYEIRVSDNGIGMSDETKGKVFEPLYSTKGFGVGLGMVITKGIVEQHHGEISIESMDGEGSTVTLRLPIKPPEDEEQ